MRRTLALSVNVGTRKSGRLVEAEARANQCDFNELVTEGRLVGGRKLDELTWVHKVDHKNRKRMRKWDMRKDV